MRWVVRNEAIMAAILISKVNSAAFREIFAALISGGLRDIDCVCLLELYKMGTLKQDLYLG